MSLTRVSVLLLALMVFGMELAFAQQTPAPAAGVAAGNHGAAAAAT